MRFILLVALFLLPVSIPVSAHAFTVEDLVESCVVCAKDFKTGVPSPECSFCDGVLTGAGSTYTLLEGGKKVCPPNNLDTHRLRNMFRLWAKRNEDSAKEPAVWGVLESYIEAYPCAR